jgi:hypothetical protein
MKSEQIDPTTGVRVLDDQGRARYSCTQNTAVAAFAPSADLTATFPHADQLESRVGELRWVQQRAALANSAAFVPLEAGGAFVDEHGIGCRPGSTIDPYFTCATEGPEVYEQGLWSDSTCEHRLYGFAGSSVADSNLSQVRHLVNAEAQPAQLLSFQSYPGATYERHEGRCERASAAGSMLEVDHVFVLPRLTRVAR